MNYKVGMYRGQLFSEYTEGRVLRRDFCRVQVPIS